MNKPTQPTIQIYARLTPGVYAALEKEVLRSNAVVTHQTTDIQAGFQLGVEHVLRAVRNGYVIQEG